MKTVWEPEVMMVKRNDRGVIVRIEERIETDQIPQLIDKLGRFYHSDYVAKNQPWILETPFEQWLQKQLAGKGIVI